MLQVGAALCSDQCSFFPGDSVAKALGLKIGVDCGEMSAHHVGGVNGMWQFYVTGEPVTALCGKKWVPSRDPQRFPVCPECKKIFEALKAAGR